MDKIHFGQIDDYDYAIICANIFAKHGFPGDSAMRLILKIIWKNPEFDLIKGVMIHGYDLYQSMVDELDNGSFSGFTGEFDKCFGL